MSQNPPYLLYDDFTQGAQGLLNGRVPLIGPGGPWVEKNLATSAPIGGGVTTPGYSVVTAAGATSTQPVMGGIAAWNTLQLSNTPGEVGFNFTLADTANAYSPTIGVWKNGQVASPGNGELHVQVANFPVLTKLVSTTAMYSSADQSGAGTCSRVVEMSRRFVVRIQSSWSSHFDERS